eukprot:584052-Heterocapsa_arctica.AAC.1
MWASNFRKLLAGHCLQIYGDLVELSCPEQIISRVRRLIGGGSDPPLKSPRYCQFASSPYG